MFLNLFLLGVLAVLLLLLVVYWIVWELSGRGGKGQRLSGGAIAAIVASSAIGMAGVVAVVTHEVYVDGPLYACIATERGRTADGPAVGTRYLIDSGCRQCDDFEYVRLRLFWPSEIARDVATPCYRTL